MKTFRDALNVAQFNRVTDPVTGITYSKGANVTLNEIEHRRRVSGDFFGKGTRSVNSSSAQIYWGTPAIDAQDNPDGTVDIKAYNLDKFQMYKINGESRDFEKYYDIDGDGIPDYKDSDIDGDGIPNDQDNDANGDGIDDEYAKNNSGMYDDLDNDGIPNWKDDDANGNGILDKDEGPGIKLRMSYAEGSIQSNTLSEDNSATNNAYDLDLTDEVQVKFVDNNGDSLPEGFDQYLVWKEGEYSYETSDVPKTAHRTIIWNTPK